MASLSPVRVSGFDVASVNARDEWDKRGSRCVLSFVGVKSHGGQCLVKERDFYLNIK